MNVTFLLFRLVKVSLNKFSNLVFNLFFFIMSKSRSNIQEMEEAFAKIQIEEEEQGGLSYENEAEELSEIDTKWCLVGRFLTESPIDFQAMQHKTASLWRPGRGMYVKPLYENKFLFQFCHEIDIM